MGLVGTLVRASLDLGSSMYPSFHKPMGALEPLAPWNGMLELLAPH